MFVHAPRSTRISLSLPSPAPCAARRLVGGFTIIEMLVVIGIISLLLSLVLYGISGARKRAHKTGELNNLRQVYFAWNLYANNNNSSALPGYLTTEVQARWKLNYEYQDKTAIPPAPNFGAGDPNIAGPWVWRLLPYLDYSHDTVRGYARDENISDNEMVANAQKIADEPGFGYNGYYIGGYWELVGTEPRARFRPQATTPLPLGETHVNIPTSVAQVNKTDKFIIFCASSHFTPGVYQKQTDDRAGDDLVIPPYLADVQQWSSGVGNTLGSGPNGAVSADITASPFVINVLAETSAPMMRYTNQAALVHADGSTTADSPGGLMDMRFWVNSASKADSTHSP
ncbi:MAG TPA: prepilin-type N-terminal cleavage/methylation domain-containing protein [Phycisphaerales bacterium]|nr:prepilin-type N-terminal cleavage/methylation domain-containing protein [Phycisphaerales bacterium]